MRAHTRTKERAQVLARAHTLVHARICMVLAARCALFQMSAHIHDHQKNGFHLTPTGEPADLYGSAALPPPAGGYDEVVQTVAPQDAAPCSYDMQTVRPSAEREQTQAQQL